MSTPENNNLRSYASSIVKAVSVLENSLKESKRDPVDGVSDALLALNNTLKALGKAAEKELKDGNDGVSVTSAALKSKNLVLTLSNGKSVDVGKVVGDDGFDGTDVDEEKLMAKLLKQIPKPQVIDEAKLIAKIVKSLPKEKRESAEDIIKKIKASKAISYNELRDLPDIIELVRKHTNHLEGGNRAVLRGASSLGQLIDVDLSGLTQDAQGNYILGSGGSPADDTPYGASWDSNTDAATKNAIYDKIESLAGGHDPVTVSDSAEIDFTLTGQNITASIIASSIDETKLDASTNASLDLADTALQPAAISDTAYGAGWNGDTTTAPSKNAIYDKIETLGGGDALVANPLSQFAATTSAQLAGVLSDETGTGSAVFATSPTLVTPALGTPSALTLTNATGLPISTGLTGAGTGVLTALGVNTGSAGAFVTFNGALGTPSSGTLTNCTGLPASGLVATTSTAVGFGSINLGHATDTTIARVSAGVISVEGVNVVTTSSTDTLTNKRVTARTGTTTSSASLTIDSDSVDRYTVTALAAGMTINAPSGTPTDGQRLVIRIKDNATGRALTWNAIFRAIGVTLPTTTVASKTMYIGCMYNTADTKWDVIAVAEEA